MTDSEGSEPLASEEAAVGSEEAHAVAEPEGSDGVRLSAEEFFAQDDWGKSIELARRYLVERNLKIAPGMSEEDVYTAAEINRGGRGLHRYRSGHAPWADR